MRRRSAWSRRSIASQNRRWSTAARPSLTDRGQVPELLVLAADRLAACRARQPRYDFLGGAQVLLGHDPRLAVDAGGLHQVVVGVLPASLPHDRWHMWVIHCPCLKGKYHNGCDADQPPRPETPARV